MSAATPGKHRFIGRQVRACKQLKQLGFRLALDDFFPYENKAELIDIAVYMLGMLSMMDRMLNIPMKQLVGETRSDWGLGCGDWKWRQG